MVSGLTLLSAESLISAELKCWAMMSVLAMSGASVWSAPFFSAGFKARTASDTQAGRRPVVTGSLGRLVCSLIDDLSVWSNYATPDWEATDYVCVCMCECVCMLMHMYKISIVGVADLSFGDIEFRLKENKPFSIHIYFPVYYAKQQRRTKWRILRLCPFNTQAQSGFHFLYSKASTFAWSHFLSRILQWVFCCGITGQYSQMTWSDIYIQWLSSPLSKKWFYIFHSKRHGLDTCMPSCSFYVPWLLVLIWSLLFYSCMGSNFQSYSKSNALPQVVTWGLTTCWNNIQEAPHFIIATHCLAFVTSVFLSTE